MTGETELKKLLQNMNPELNEGAYVFCTLDHKETPIIPVETIAWFHEREGMTVVLSKNQADKLGLTYANVFAWITLNIHSSLEAVGLTAAVSRALSQAGISCNMIAAYYHDHLFVPLESAHLALEILHNLTGP
jgi:uncharacterized protein